jgi:hypothetical protein
MAISGLILLMEHQSKLLRMTIEESTINYLRKGLKRNEV